MGTIKSFEELECWKISRELRIFVSQKILPVFPKDEKFSLFSQLRRSSRSISDNISACRMARGSLHESLNQVITAFDENYIEQDLLNQFREKFEKTKALLNGYINYLKKAKEANK